MELTVSRSYSEHVVVTDLALVRVERRSEEELRQASAIVLVGGALIGPPLAALAEWIGLPGGPTRLYLPRRATPELETMRDVFTCWASEIPVELATHPGWPRIESFRPVTFYPRAAIESVRGGRLGGLVLTLRREAAREVALSMPLWARRRLLSHLRRAGYPLREAQAG